MKGCIVLLLAGILSLRCFIPLFADDSADLGLQVRSAVLMDYKTGAVCLIKMEIIPSPRRLLQS
jgi:hypothetical protein